MKPGVWVRFAMNGPRLEQHRKSMRLPGYDYSQVGAYYITLCTDNRQCLFGTIADGCVCLNQNGQIVQEEWLRTEALRAEITLDAFVVMPNHFHAIVIFRDLPGVSPADALSNGSVGKEGTEAAFLHRLPRSLGSLVGGFKGAVTRRINAARDTPAVPIWQRNYHERIIRHDDHLQRTRLYIANNPARWQDDVNNPANLPLPPAD